MMKKKPKNVQTPNTKKQAKSANNPESYLKKHPSWHFSDCDTDHERWGFRIGNVTEDVYKKILDYETMTWDDVLKANGGRKAGNNSHYISYQSLCKEAKDRIDKLNLGFKTDNLFSLRLTGTKRLFGFLYEDGILKILWLDNNHEVCPTQKK